MALRERVLTGIRWSLAGQLARQFLSLGIGILLARLLVPGDFGLIAMAMVAVAFAQSVLEAGLSPALVQREDLRPDHLASAWWAAMLAGLAFVAIFWWGAPLLAMAFDQPQLTTVTRALVLVFPAASLGLVPRALAQRHLAFRRIATADFLGALLAGATAIALALEGRGVGALVAQAFVQAAVPTVLLWPRRGALAGAVADGVDAAEPVVTGLTAYPSGRATSELWTFSKHVMGSRTITYWGYNLDNLVVGKFLGAFALGLYTRAYALLLLPLANASRVLNQVLLPAYARMQDDLEALARSHRRAVRAVSIAVVPLAFGLAITAEPFVVALYTRKWVGMVPVLQILGVVLPVVAVRQLYGNLFLACGRPDTQLRLDLAMKAVTLTAIVVGVRWGLPGVAAGIAIAIAINTVPQLWAAGRLVGLNPRDAFADAAPAIGLGLVMAIGVASVDAVLPALISWQRLGVLVASGAVFYGGGLLIVRPRGARDIWATMRGASA